MVALPRLRGELVLSSDEYATIVAAGPQLIRSDGSMAPGHVVLVVPSDDRLTRVANGFVSLMRDGAKGKLEMLCMAYIATCPVVEISGEHFKTSNHCFRGQFDEWWIILQGGKILRIHPPDPLRPGRDAIVVIESFDAQAPKLLSRRSFDQVDITVNGIH